MYNYVRGIYEGMLLACDCHVVNVYHGEVMASSVNMQYSIQCDHSILFSEYVMTAITHKDEPKASLVNYRVHNSYYMRVEYYRVIQIGPSPLGSRKLQEIRKMLNYNKNAQKFFAKFGMARK